MNVAVVIIDTLRYDYISANGNPNIKTPNIDRLIGKSWNFHKAFAASFPTIPHRTDVITGRYGAPFHPWKCLDFDVVTLPRWLAEKGYCSQLIHDTPHLVNGAHGFDFPFDAWMPIRGAEVDRAWITDSWIPMSNWKFDPLFDEFDVSMEEVMRIHHAITCYIHTNRGREKEEDWNAAKLFSTAAQFLKDNKTRENFFLWVDCFDPHEPWDAPPEFMKMYDKTTGYDGTIDPRSFHFRNNNNISEAARNRIKAEYSAKVTFMDKWFGVFLDALEETGLDKNTAVILTSDHGTNVGDREGKFGKAGPPRENESHVPFVVYMPGSGSGVSDAIVQPQDVFATVMSCIGEEGALPDGINSNNLLDIANGNIEKRNIALAGTSIGNWGRAGKDRIIFSAFNKEWRLGFAANPEKCELQKLGSMENIAQDNTAIVSKMHAEAINEIERRGLDPELLKWLRSNGENQFPESFQVTDAHPAPAGWVGGYWNKMYKSMKMPKKRN
ncbi:sulfatase-like hydrolase/transferase [Candidatus Poribacteria bacterium]|nr:sulfatase-like hydrolase/transferase [Candidatus Poribacteria bacterium]